MRMTPSLPPPPFDTRVREAAEDSLKTNRNAHSEQEA
jgi:hypothetical protein